MQWNVGETNRLSWPSSEQPLLMRTGQADNTVLCPGSKHKYLQPALLTATRHQPEQRQRFSVLNSKEEISQSKMGTFWGILHIWLRKLSSRDGEVK